VALDELKQTPAYKAADENEAQIGGLMARKECIVARELHPSFPIC
jgi:hypothetical protein